MNRPGPLRSALPALLAMALLAPGCKPKQEVVQTGHTAEVAPDRPAWVETRPVADGDYIGIGSCPKSRPDYQETAKKNALNDLASEISVTVEGNSLLYTLDRKNQFKEEFTSTINTSTKEQIEGYELVGSYADAGSYWLYYRLGKAEYARIKAERKQQALDQALDFYRRGAATLATGDLKSAFDLDLRGLMAMKNYWGSNDQVVVDGRSVSLANELFNDLQKMTSGVRLAVLPERCALNWANHFKRELLITATSTAPRRPLAQLPITVTFSGQGGPVTESRNTDAEGRARTTVQRVATDAAAPEVVVRLDVAALVGKDLDPAFTKPLVGSLTVPEVHVPIDRTMPKFWVKAAESNLGTPLEDAPIALAAKQQLTALGFRAVDREAEADLVLETTGKTRQMGESNGFFTAGLDYTVKVRDRQSGETVYEAGKQGAKGIQLSLDKAGTDAYKRAADDLRSGMMPALLTAILGQ